MGTMIKIGQLTAAMVKVSEKAGLLARSIRSHESLLSLLVEEKSGEEKNKRFVRDFKTLADVLVQELVKHELGSQFPGLAENIFGEESNKFTNTSGTTIEVSIKESQDDTAQLLKEILDGNEEAAKALAEVIHTDVPMETDTKLQSLNTSVSIENTGIWIDPIDSTAQYIHGFSSVESEGTGVYFKGLQCVSVLIGAYDMTTGEAIAGVINQPFCSYGDDGWRGRHLWGISVGDVNLSHIQDLPSAISRQQHKWSVMSTSEGIETRSKVASAFHVCFAAGAGYKVLCVCDQLVSVYILSQPTCFKWDTCGPHAILKALGGGIVDLKKALDTMKIHQGRHEFQVIPLLEECSIKYAKPDRDDLPPGEKWSNSGGLIAFDTYQSLIKVLEVIMGEDGQDD